MNEEARKHVLWVMGRLFFIKRSNQLCILVERQNNKLCPDLRVEHRRYTRLLAKIFGTGISYLEYDVMLSNATCFLFFSCVHGAELVHDILSLVKCLFCGFQFKGNISDCTIR